jgi:hypothetical protein
MGIGCRLRRVESADGAREQAKLAIAGRVRDTVASLLRRLDSFGELYEAD